MKFVIYKVHNGFLLNIVRNGKTTSYVYTEEQRMRMLAEINRLLGPEPEADDN